jgi:hypothetical protein
MTMTNLSPAAQAVLDAFEDAPYYPEQRDGPSIAAVLLAAADCLPIQPLTREPPDQFEMGLSQGQALSRAILLAIADELKTQ